MWCACVLSATCLSHTSARYQSSGSHQITRTLLSAGMTQTLPIHRISNKVHKKQVKVVQVLLGQLKQVDDGTSGDLCVEACAETSSVDGSVCSCTLPGRPRRRHLLHPHAKLGGSDPVLMCPSGWNASHLLVLQSPGNLHGAKPSGRDHFVFVCTLNVNIFNCFRRRREHGGYGRCKAWLEHGGYEVWTL